MKKYGVIMAGGGGTRFWPLSRQKTPKQLLNLSGKELMINEAIDRLEYIVDKKNMFVVTNKTQVASMLEATKKRISANHILSEPAARNTAACIGYAAMEIIKKYGDGVMIITPSDHFVKDTAGFVRVLNMAVDAAEKTDKLITIGIKPTFPSTGFGYIKYDSQIQDEVKPVIEFREKPDEKTAKNYLDSGQYVWNSGMFIWKASVILKKFEKYIPDIYEVFTQIANAIDCSKEEEMVNLLYPSIRKISIDYAIMEPAANDGDVLVVPGEFGWSDIGSWDMMNILHEVDKNGNIILGDVLAVNTTNTTVYSSKKFVGVTDVDNLVIVETADAIMVCSKDKAQNVKLIVDALNEKKRKELL